MDRCDFACLAYGFVLGMFMEATWWLPILSVGVAVFAFWYRPYVVRKFAEKGMD